MTELNKLYNKKDISITEALKEFAAMPVNAEADKALNFKYKKDETEHDTIFEDFCKAKNTLRLTHGFVGLFSGGDECTYVCYKALSMIFKKVPSGRTGYMQVFTYKRKKFWLVLEDEHIVFLLPEEY